MVIITHISHTDDHGHLIKKETADALKVSQFAEREAADNRRSSEVSEEYVGFMFRNLEFLLTMFDLQILIDIINYN